jgi:hypothetical protein
MDNEKLEPVQSIRIIESMIHNARNRFSDNGHLYLLWGWVVLICSLGHFAGIKWNLHEHPEWIWSLTWVALLYQTIYLLRQKKKIRVSTYTGDMLKAIWTVFFVCGVLLALVVGRLNDWKTMYSLILMLYGIPTVLSGTVLRFKPLIWGGIFCWVLCIISIYLPYTYILLLVSIAVIAAWIIPGYLMQQKFANENKIK